MPKENIHVILVDPADRKLGTCEKILAHQYGMLHRAFSVFIFRYVENKLETLLQKRAKHKYHAANLWSNSCCSHPCMGERIVKSAENRLSVEMGITVKLKNVGKFHYIAQFENGLTENEIDHVMIGMFDHDSIQFNPEEVSAFKWIEVNALQKDLSKYPKKYSPWLNQALKVALAGLKSLAGLK